ncbi:MAG: ABC transporter permease [Treponema sp.]|nr:ABC transporter permease [Treponema sp.]
MNPDVVKYLSVIGTATWQTLVMVFFSAVFSMILGIPLGILLCTTDSSGGLRPNRVVNQTLSIIINVLRAIPFVILVILLFPFTRFVVHTAIGTKASVVPLTIAAAPFVARVIESSLKEVDAGVIQAARAMGSDNKQIIFKVLMPEALPSIVNGITLTVINLIGYSAMAGTVGGGGLGDVAIRYGYQRYRFEYMLGSVAIILILVEVIQVIGTRISNKMQANR